jgi:hypothetical protein
MAHRRNGRVGERTTTATDDELAMVARMRRWRDEA